MAGRKSLRGRSEPIHRLRRPEPGFWPGARPAAGGTPASGFPDLARRRTHQRIHKGDRYLVARANACYPLTMRNRWLGSAVLVVVVFACGKTDLPGAKPEIEEVAGSTV